MKYSIFNCNRFQVEDLVSNDKLNVVSEEQVFVAVMDWIKHNPTERSQYIAQVRSNYRNCRWNNNIIIIVKHIIIL